MDARDHCGYFRPGGVPEDAIPQQQDRHPTFHLLSPPSTGAIPLLGVGPVHRWQYRRLSAAKLQKRSTHGVISHTSRARQRLHPFLPLLRRPGRFGQPYTTTQIQPPHPATKQARVIPHPNVRLPLRHVNRVLRTRQPSHQLGRGFSRTPSTTMEGSSEPEAEMARLPVHFVACSNVHSDVLGGFERGKTMGPVAQLRHLTDDRLGGDTSDRAEANRVGGASRS